MDLLRKFLTKILTICYVISCCIRIAWKKPRSKKTVVKASESPLNAALHDALMLEDCKRCELLLRRGAAVNHRFHLTDETPLSLAVKTCVNSISMQRKIVCTLLDYGASVSDEVRGKRILEIVAGNESSRVLISALIIRHMVTMEYQNIDIDEADRRVIESSTWYKSFYLRCVQEMEATKKTTFYKGITLFHILTASGQMMCDGFSRKVHLTQSELLAALEDRHYIDKYPIYATTLKKRFYDIAKKRALRRTASIVLSNLLEFNDHYHPVNQKILTFFRDADLEQLQI